MSVASEMTGVTPGVADDSSNEALVIVDDNSQGNFSSGTKPEYLYTLMFYFAWALTMSLSGGHIAKTLDCRPIGGWS